MDSLTIFSLREQLATRLMPELHSRELARSYSWQLLTHLLGCDRAELCARTTIALTAKQHELLETWVHEIVDLHKPIAYIIGSIPFLELSLFTRPPVLIPRPETEWWTELLITALRSMPSEKFTLIDLCTGSGCIALSVAKRFPKSSIWGVDISPEAISLAQANAEKNSIKNCRFVVSDLFDRLPKELRADIITANPPYISEKEFELLDPSVKNWEDLRALVSGGPEGLGLIKKIIEKTPDYITDIKTHIPRLWIEIGANHQQAVVQLPLLAPFSRMQINADLTGNPRLVRFYS